MITWSDVAVVIPTVADRRSMLEDLLVQLTESCPGMLLLIQEHVRGEPARVDFPRALARAAATGRPWVLQFEDDVRLAPGFGALALAHVGESDVLTLFSRSKADLAALERGEETRRIGPASFSMSQAFFVRASRLEGIEAFAERWYGEHPEHNRGADLLLAAFLSEKKASVLVRVPSLVQHLPGPSTLPGHYGARQSESYRKVFGDV